MRDIPEELAARIEGGAATLCHAWILTRRDGGRLGFTDHDRDLRLNGVDCRARSGWTRGADDSAAGLACGNLSASGVLDDDAISEADLSAGDYDGAEVEVWKLDWRRPDLKVRLSNARLARVRREGDAFVAELEGPLAKLERVVGRTYGRECDAVLGDSRCRLPLDAFPGASCDGRWSTCTAQFGNGMNFQGFPDIPGDDFVAAVPTEGGANDGGSRR